MKKFFDTRSMAREFAKNNNLSVKDNGSQCAKGLRWYVEYVEVAVSIEPVAVSASVVAPKLTLKKVNKNKSVSSLADLGKLCNTQYQTTLTQKNKGRVSTVSVKVKRSINKLMCK